MEIGIVGKPNVGKSTLFSALTLVDVPIASYPFTTIDTNVGVGYVRTNCVCKEFGVKDNPKNSFCINGNRFIPIKIIDTAGLVPDAWKGRGLGNIFLNKISMADALIHIIDVSGSTDIEGNPTSPGSHDPLEDINFLFNEIVRWLFSIIMKHWSSIKKAIDLLKQNPIDALEKILSGVKLNRYIISESYKDQEQICGSIIKWSEECILNFTKSLIKKGKPLILAANKIDFPQAEENLERIRSTGYDIIPISAISELVLKKLASKNIVSYLPGDNEFNIVNDSKLTDKQKKALKRIEHMIFRKYNGTGVQKLINHVVFDVLNYIVVYPVKDPNKLSDAEGNVLPDAYLIFKGTTLREFAYLIHTEIGKRFLYGIDARRKTQIKGDYILKNNDVVSVVTS